MSKTKLIRCAADGCRELTANEFCEAHQAQQEADRKLIAELDAERRRWHRRERAREVVAEIERDYRAALARRSALLREELAGLKAAAARADRAGERPRFSHA